MMTKTTGNNTPRIAILTGGGDTPALNASIEAIRNRAREAGYRVLGIRRGWKGLLGDGDLVDISKVTIDGSAGGTFLRSSRTNPFAPGNEGRKAEVLKNIRDYHIDVLVVIGGDDTIGAARQLFLQEKVPVIAFPKTIDNDLRTHTMIHIEGQQQEVVLCPGFPSAADAVVTYINRLKTYALSHERVLVVEVMGRDAGWLAGAASQAGAHFVLIPEVVMNQKRKERFIEQVAQAYRHSNEGFLLVAVAEGVQWYDDNAGVAKYVHAATDRDEFGHPAFGGVSGTVAADIKKATGLPAKGVVSGFFPRAGRCGAYDRKLTEVLAERLQVMLQQKDYGSMPVIAAMGGQDDLSLADTTTIDLAAVKNMALPEYFYDEQHFTVNDAYNAFIGDVISSRNEAVFSPALPQVHKVQE